MITFLLFLIALPMILTIVYAIIMIMLSLYEYPAVRLALKIILAIITAIIYGTIIILIIF